LQSELAALETELADPSNPLLHNERAEDNVDAGDLIRGLVDVRARLEKIRKEKEGRGRLVSVVMGDALGVQRSGEDKQPNKVDGPFGGSKGKTEKQDIQVIVEIDRRVGYLEKLVGSSSAALDEVRACTADCMISRTDKIPGIHPRYRPSPHLSYP
jgi:nuclear migration protein JNM1